METHEEQVRRWSGMFDGLAEIYDQSGVAFFGPIAAGLVDRLAPGPGDRVVDVGAGRGAATFRFADRVGPTGRVDAIDLSAAMVALTAAAAQAHGYDQVSVQLGDARDPQLEPASYDVVAASLVLFFLPDPGAALRAWRRLLAPGGRLGVSTFRPWLPTWQAIEDLFEEYADPSAAPATTAMPDVFGDDAGVEGLLEGAGLRDVRTETMDLAVRFADVEEWRSWSHGTAMRGLWQRAPEESHAEIVRRVDELLRSAPGADGALRLDAGIRYTLGSAG